MAYDYPRLALCVCGHLRCDHEQRLAPLCDGGGVGCAETCREFVAATSEQIAAMNASPMPWT